jgi:hypothetical protein
LRKPVEKMENFEDFLKEQGDNFSIKPGNRVWEGVEASLNKEKRKLAWLYISGIAVILILGVGSYFMIHDNKEVIGTTQEKKTIIQGQNPTGANKNSKAPENTDATINAAKEPNKPLTLQSSASYKEVLRTNKLVTQEKINTPALPNSNALNDYATEVNARDNNLKSVKAESLREPDLLMVSPYSYPKPAIKNENKKNHFMASAGINLSYVLSNNRSFMKPAMGYQAIVSYSYSFHSIYAFNFGLGYQQPCYKVGAVQIEPELVMLQNGQNSSLQTANYRLNNEVYLKNAIHELILPLDLEAYLWNKADQKISVNTGVTLSKTFAKRYLIKIPSSDRIFEERTFINPYLVYYSAGTTYYFSRHKGPDLFASYKIQFQLNNTYRFDFDIREHYIVHGLSFGIVL